MRVMALLGAAWALPVLVAAQPATSGEQSACVRELRWLHDYAERNYAGFEYKVIGAAEARYAALVEELLREASAAETDGSCDALAARWVAFFGDGHLSVSRRPRAVASAASRPGDSPAAIRARFADAPARPLPEPLARERMNTLGASRHPIEGIWEMQGGNYRGVVLRDDSAATSFSMSILRADSVWWVPGQVKAVFSPTGDAEYAVRFYLRDHSEQRWTARVRGNVLTFDSGSPWLREWPVLPGDLSPAALAEASNGAFRVREPGLGTLLMQLPSFNEARAMDSLFEAEGARIRAAERLVIDLRGNGGGSDHNFRMLIPLIYAGPIRVVSNALLATADNIAVNEALAADTTLPMAVRISLRANIARMREAPGRWYEYEDRVVEGLPVLETPRRVDLIVDRGCASSCEQFLLAARQSAKVTIYGSNSAGILDFGNVRSAQMPDGTLQLNYPTTRSKRLPHDPVDGAGIAPHVEIPESEVDPIGWVLRRP